MPDARRVSWGKYFGRSSTPFFVIGSTRRLRYANFAWIDLVGEPWAKYRGVKVSNRTTDSLPGTLAPPAEVWHGRTASVRRAVPGQTNGPPWWDIQFVPLTGAGAAVPLGVLGFITAVAPTPAQPKRTLPENVAQARTELAKTYDLSWLDGPSLCTRRLAAQVRAAALSELPVWLHGEAGTGKTTIARIVHHQSPRKERSFLAISGGALPANHLEGMLFGKGGLAGSKAVGTLYLRYPERLPTPLQTRLWAWVDSATGPRLVCGSTVPALAHVTALNLHPEYCTRGSAMEIAVPSLRERTNDWPTLIARCYVGTVSSEALHLLQRYNWPGNFRELKQVFHNAQTAELQNEQLPRAIQNLAHLPLQAARPLPKLDELLAIAELNIARLALHRAGGNRRTAADQLGITTMRLKKLLDQAESGT
jgi:DNA-binding NtrC family response regulator